MADPSRKQAAVAAPSGTRATYADLEAVPPELVAEIIDGVLVTHPRPSPRHSAAANSIGDELTGPFQKGRGGPGGWVFFVEPELHLGHDVVVPDLAGWQAERVSLPPDAKYFETAPDWVCEVLSPSTERRDRGSKRRIYAKAGVGHLWFIDPRLQLLEAFTLSAGHWLLAGSWTGADVANAPPFEAVSISLAHLWPLDRPLGFAENPQPLFAGDR